MDNNKYSLSNGQAIWLITLRVLIGWHFLYEGLVKLANPNWTATGYLMDSEWIFRDIFISLASNPGTMEIVDFLNVWGLIAIGAGLILGIFTRIATLSGIVLLAMYFISHPPFLGYNYSVPSEGSYLIVNKILIEMFAMIVLVLFPTGKILGIDRLICRKK